MPPETGSNPARPQPPTRGDFVHFRTITTRWMDVDVYGHVNNANYYSYFDTAVTGYLVERAGLDSQRSTVVAFAVESGCTFREPLRFPESIEVGIRAARIETSSITYEIGIFKQGAELPAAFGRFVHVYVDRATERPVPIPPEHREVLELLRVESSDGE